MEENVENLSNRQLLKAMFQKMTVSKTPQPRFVTAKSRVSRKSRGRPSSSRQESPQTLLEKVRVEKTTRKSSFAPLNKSGKNIVKPKKRDYDEDSSPESTAKDEDIYEYASEKEQNQEKDKYESSTRNNRSGIPKSNKDFEDSSFQTQREQMLTNMEKLNSSKSRRSVSRRIDFDDDDLGLKQSEKKSNQARSDSPKISNKSIGQKEVLQYPFLESDSQSSSLSDKKINNSSVRNTQITLNRDGKISESKTSKNYESSRKRKSRSEKTKKFQQIQSYSSSDEKIDKPSNATPKKSVPERQIHTKSNRSVSSKKELDSSPSSSEHSHSNTSRRTSKNKPLSTSSNLEQESFNQRKISLAKAAADLQQLTNDFFNRSLSIEQDTPTKEEQISKNKKEAGKSFALLGGRETSSKNVTKFRPAESSHASEVDNSDDATHKTSISRNHKHIEGNSSLRSNKATNISISSRKHAQSSTSRRSSDVSSVINNTTFKTLMSSGSDLELQSTSSKSIKKSKSRATSQESPKVLFNRSLGTQNEVLNLIPLSQGSDTPLQMYSRSRSQASKRTVQIPVLRSPSSDRSFSSSPTHQNDLNSLKNRTEEKEQLKNKKLYSFTHQSSSDSDDGVKVPQDISPGYPNETFTTTADKRQRKTSVLQETRYSSQNSSRKRKYVEDETTRDGNLSEAKENVTASESSNLKKVKISQQNLSKKAKYHKSDYESDYSNSSHPIQNKLTSSLNKRSGRDQSGLKIKKLPSSLLEKSNPEQSESILNESYGHASQAYNTSIKTSFKEKSQVSRVELEQISESDTNKRSRTEGKKSRRSNVEHVSGSKESDAPKLDEKPSKSTRTENSAAKSKYRDNRSMKGSESWRTISIIDYERADSSSQDEQYITEDTAAPKSQATAAQKRSRPLTPVIVASQLRKTAFLSPSNRKQLFSSGQSRSELTLDEPDTFNKKLHSTPYREGLTNKLDMLAHEISSIKVDSQVSTSHPVKEVLTKEGQRKKKERVEKAVFSEEIAEVSEHEVDEREEYEIDEREEHEADGKKDHEVDERGEHEVDEREEHEVDDRELEVGERELEIGEREEHEVEEREEHEVDEREEHEIDEREHEVDEREYEVDEREYKVDEREYEVDEREKPAVVQREQEVIEREELDVEESEEEEVEVPTQSRPKRKRRSRGSIVDSDMPESLIRNIVEFYAGIPVALSAGRTLQKCVKTFWKHLFKNLTAYANHAGRNKIEMEDFELLLYRLGFVKDRNSLNALIENYLPLEMRRELIPMAQAGNVIVP